jgi:hypothetical protein
MLIKEMENKLNLADQTSFMLDSSDGGDAAPSGGCCSSSSSRGVQQDQTQNLLDSSTSWLQCMWNSAQACAGSGAPASSSLSVGGVGQQSSRASRFLGTVLSFAGSMLGAFLALFAYVYNRILNSHTTIYHIYTLWLIRWRSSIIQRLMQSVFIQIYYICSTLFSDDDNDDRDNFL